MDDETRKEKGIGTLPGSLSEALEEMKTSKLVKDVLGEHAYKSYIKGKTMEVDEYRMTVTRWELERYLNIFN